MKFSLVIGSKNPNLEWLNQALKSAEGLFDETIIVDDGSDIPIIGSTARHEASRGFYEARNTGIELATGDIICSLDDDDIFDRYEVTCLKEFVEDNPRFDIYHFPIELFGNQTGYAFVNSNPEDLLDGNQLPSGSWFTKKCWKDLGGFTYPLAEDWSFWIKALAKNKKFKYYNQPVYKHRMRDDSLSAGWVGDKFLKIRDDIRKEYQDCLHHDRLGNKRI